MKVGGGCYFFTAVTHRREPLFDDPRTVDLLFQAIGRMQQRHPFSIDAHVVLPDHLHMIWSLPLHDADFSKRWMLIKSAFTRAYRKRHASGPRADKRPIWQDRFWEHLIRDERDYAAHVEYIHFNPVKHGFVRAPRNWLHSSFRAFVECGLYELGWGDGMIPELPTCIRGE